jgi:hypothetical protein
VAVFEVPGVGFAGAESGGAGMSRSGKRFKGWRRERLRRREAKGCDLGRAEEFGPVVDRVSVIDRGRWAPAEWRGPRVSGGGEKGGGRG